MEASVAWEIFDTYILTVQYHFCESSQVFVKITRAKLYGSRMDNLAEKFQATRFNHHSRSPGEEQSRLHRITFMICCSMSPRLAMASFAGVEW